jgi:hypothetical protein
LALAVSLHFWFNDMFAAAITFVMVYVNDGLAAQRML